jgi:hypothetical protein
MSASYPNSVKVFTTKTTGQVIQASHINEPQDEITAIEQGLLQGLAHALFPNTDAGKDLGTTTRRWRNLLVQKIVAGITNATKLRIQEVGTSTWITVNADFDGTNWNREDTTQPAQGIEINNNKEVKYYRAVAGANPITWTDVFTISTDRIIASQAVIGTDPGGTEVLRAQNLRAGPTTITGALYTTDTISAPTAVIGTDPGGTESLRAGSARLNAPVLLGSVPQFTMAADPTESLQVATKQYADTKLARDTAETITARHTFNPSTTGAPFLVGANASGQLVSGLNADMVDGLHASELVGGGGAQPPTISVFTTPGTYTWTKPANCKKIWIRCWGGGGGGGGANGNGGVAYGGGGGGGGYAERLLDVTSISSATVVVGSGGSGGSATPTSGGPGGNSSFSVGGTTYVQANGGSGGGYASGSGSAGGGGSGGTATSGAGGFAIRGGYGWKGSSVFGEGRGGESPMGGPGFSIAPGGGGNGALDYNTSGAAGNAGAAGAVVIFEYY